MNRNLSTTLTRPHAGPGDKRTMLVVDDNEISQKLLRVYLANLGHHVLACNDGYSALEVLEQETIDLVFLDLHMPVMNGFETAREIRQLEDRNRHIPVIGLSADGLPESLTKALEAGMNEYLVKPIRQDDLVMILRRWLPEQPAAPQARDTGPASPGLQDLRRMLAREMPDYKDRLLEALGTRDHHEIYEVVHLITGGSAYCELPALHTASKRVQTAAAHSDDNQINRHADQLLTEIEHFLQGHEASTASERAGATRNQAVD